jgi:hypothetical protein
MNPEGVRYITNIIKSVKGGNRVRPAKITVEGGECVEWRNLSREPVRLVFDQGSDIFIEFRGSKTPGTIDIPYPGSIELHVLTSPRHGDYAYQVVGANSGDYYNGDSDPRIDVL